MEIEVVLIKKPEEINFILGQSHFIKTVEDMHEALVSAVPGIKFGLAFCEASGMCLVRCSGTNADLVELAKARPAKPPSWWRSGGMKFLREAGSSLVHGWAAGAPVPARR